MAITATISGGAVQLTGNPVEILCSGGSLPAGATQYKILLKIISQDSKLFGAPFIDSKAMDDSGEALFDISGYVDQPVTAVFQWPVAGSMNYYPTQAFNIQVQSGESYIDSNGDLQEVWGAASAVLQMLKGGLSPRQVAVMRDAGYTFYAKYIQAGKFLSARPWGDNVHPTQPVKLWFIPVASSTANFNVKAYYDDGTDASYALSIDFNIDNLYEFNCNPATLGIPMEPTGKKISHFDVWITGLSESRRFTIDWRYCERPVFLMFANTFGGVDDVYLSGFIQDKFATEGEQSYRPAQNTDTVFTPTLLDLNKAGQNKWSINSGWKPLVTIQYLRDLLVAKQAWYIYTNITQTTTSIIPITDIKTGDVLINRQEDLYSIQIDFSEAHTSKHSFDNRSF